MSEEVFVTEPGFCPVCGSILPDLKASALVACYTCGKEYGPQAFGKMEVKYTINFNSIDDLSVQYKKKLEEEDGPTVERKCPVCGNNKMSYATLQLRSADEGQTVFYTCTKCKYKETENS